MINFSFEHTGKQIGTLTGEWLKETLLPMPQGLARGFASVPIQRQYLSFIIQHDSMGQEHRTQMGEANARCQPLAVSLSLSLQPQMHMHTLQHWLPLFPLASPSCLLLWPDEPSLFICYYIGVVRSKNQEGSWDVCQRCWLKVSVRCHPSPLWPPPFIHTCSLNRFTSLWVCTHTCVHLYKLQFVRDQLHFH